MPKVEDIFSQLNGAKYYWTLGPMMLDTTIFLWMNFQYLRLHLPHHLEITEYIKVPFRLTQAPADFQELMARILKEFQLCLCLSGQHYHLQQDSKRTPRPHKTSFFKGWEVHTYQWNTTNATYITKEIHYLGHILNNKVIRPLPSKTQAIQNMYPPKIPKQVHCISMG